MKCWLSKRTHTDREQIKAVLTEPSSGFFSACLFIQKGHCMNPDLMHRNDIEIVAVLSYVLQSHTWPKKTASGD